MKFLEKIIQILSKGKPDESKFTALSEKTPGATAKVIPLYPKTKKGKIIFF